MNVIVSVLPILGIFILGYVLKFFKIANSQDGSFLLKLIFYIGFPALAFMVIESVEFNLSLVSLFILPTVSVLVYSILFTVLRFTIFSHIPIKTFGALMMGVLIMNSGFILPFVEALYGFEGVVRIVLIDVGNAIATFVLTYSIAVYFGGGKVSYSTIVKKLITSPPIWAIIIAFSLKLFGILLPDVLMNVFEKIAVIVPTIILLALGIKFSPTFANKNLLVSGLVLRFFVGFVLGLLYVTIFRLEGLDAIISILVFSAPFGFNSITFSDMEKLDIEFVASLVSVGILVGLVSVPLLSMYLNTLYL